jgi:hypothetical protein
MEMKGAIRSKGIVDSMNLFKIPFLNKVDKNRNRKDVQTIMKNIIETVHSSITYTRCMKSILGWMALSIVLIAISCSQFSGFSTSSAELERTNTGTTASDSTRLFTPSTIQTSAVSTTTSRPSPIFGFTEQNEEPTIRPVEGYFELSYDLRYSDDKNPDAWIDLDTIQIINNQSTDIQLLVTQGSNTFAFLYPIHEAVAKSIGNKNIYFGDCRKYKEMMSKAGINNLTIGNRICVLTNRGRFILLLIVNSHSLTDNSMIVQFFYQM